MPSEAGNPKRDEHFASRHAIFLDQLGKIAKDLEQGVADLETPKSKGKAKRISSTITTKQTSPGRKRETDPPLVKVSLEFPCSVKALSVALDVTAARLLRLLMQRGAMLSLTSLLDNDVARDIALELGFELELIEPISSVDASQSEKTVAMFFKSNFCSLPYLNFSSSNEVQENSRSIPTRINSRFLTLGGSLAETHDAFPQNSLNRLLQVLYPNALVYAHVGIFQFMTGDFAKADLTLKQAEPTALVQYYLGKNCLFLEEYEQSLGYYEEAAKVGFSKAWCQLARAEVLRYLGRKDESKRLLDTLFITSHLNLGAEYLYQRAATLSSIHGHTSEVLTLYQQTLEVAPWHAGALLGLAVENEAIGKFKEANELFSRGAYTARTSRIWNAIQQFLTAHSSGVALLNNTTNTALSREALVAQIREQSRVFESGLFERFYDVTNINSIVIPADPTRKSDTKVFSTQSPANPISHTPLQILEQWLASGICAVNNMKAFRDAYKLVTHVEDPGQTIRGWKKALSEKSLACIHQILDMDSLGLPPEAFWRGPQESLASPQPLGKFPSLSLDKPITNPSPNDHEELQAAFNTLKSDHDKLKADVIEFNDMLLRAVASNRLDEPSDTAAHGQASSFPAWSAWGVAGAAIDLTPLVPLAMSAVLPRTVFGEKQTLASELAIGQNALTTASKVFGLLNEGSKRIREIIQLLEAKPSEDFAVATKDMQFLLDNVRTEMAERLTPIINAKLKSMPHETYEDKKAICRYLTETLQPLFLAVRSNDGTPAILAASANDGSGVFRFSVSREGPKRFVHSSATLPEITLIPRPPRVEGIQRHK